MYVLFSIRILELIKSRSNYLKQATGGWHSVRVKRNFYKSLTEINQKYFIVKCFILFLHFAYHHYINRLVSKLTWNGSLSIVIKPRDKKLQRFLLGIWNGIDFWVYTEKVLGKRTGFLLGIILIWESFIRILSGGIVAVL